jgi:hypothetical protein
MRQNAAGKRYSGVFSVQGRHGTDIDSTRYQIAAAIRNGIRYSDKVENRKGCASAILFFVNPMIIISLQCTSGNRFCR